MYLWEIKLGRLSQNGSQLGFGYAGGNLPPHHDATAVNNPDRTSEHNVGPLPVGKYHIGAAQNGTHLGPIAMPLYPHQDNVMFGRGGFWLHADSVVHPGQASEGCPIINYQLRLLISQGLDRELEVVRGDLSNVGQVTTEQEP